MAAKAEKKEKEKPPITGLALLREPFPEHQIGKLPKGTKKQNECDFNQKEFCNVCKQYHHPDVKHLDFVGHAALTARLLDVDPNWYWEPLAFGADGLPKFDGTGGLWIRLHVLDTIRIGYGHAKASQYKDVGAREKECIGDALRNAAMRGGAALDLWHKGELYAPVEDNTDKTDPTPATSKKKPPAAKQQPPETKEQPSQQEGKEMTPVEYNEKVTVPLGECTTKVKLDLWIKNNKPWIDSLPVNDLNKVRKDCQEYFDIFKKDNKG